MGVVQVRMAQFNCILGASRWSVALEMTRLLFMPTKFPRRGFRRRMLCFPLVVVS